MRQPRRRLDAFPASRSLRPLLILVAAGLLAVGLVGRDRLAIGAEPPVFPDRVQAAAEKIDPNTASVASLQRLPGIGPIRAQGIDLYRRDPANPPFRTVDDLQRVPGIGAGTVRTLRPYVALPSEAR